MIRVAPFFGRVFAVALLFLTSYIDAAHAGRLPRVVLTAFEPFGGRKSNESMVSAQAIKKQLQGKAEVEVIVLPVEYGAAQKILTSKLAAGPKPAFVLSLGESPMNEPHLEPTAYNNNSRTLRDSAGRFAQNKSAENGPGKLKLSLYEKLKDSPAAISTRLLSKKSTIGNFVCNNTAYQMQSQLSASNIAYGFLHVPAKRKLNSTESAALGKTLESALPGAEVAAPTKTGESQPCATKKRSWFSRVLRPE